MTFAHECFCPCGQSKNDQVDLFFQKTFDQVFDEQTEDHVFQKDLPTSKILWWHNFYIRNMSQSWKKKKNSSEGLSSTFNF